MHLTLVTVDGVEHPVDATPATIFATLRDLDPDHHRRLDLRYGPIAASAWPRTHAADALGTGCLRVELGGETRWLGRVSAPGSLTIGETTMPSMVEVPVVWISSVLARLARASQWPTYFPWYGGDPLSPLNSWSGDSYSFEELERATDRASLLRQLQVELREELSAEPFSGARARVIAELRRVGHDLWSWDYDGDIEQWGADYMRSAKGAGLRLSLGPSVVELGFGDLSTAPEGSDES